jgi:hypothetical protein
MDDNSPEFLNNSIPEPETAINPVVTFQGNNYDLAAVVGVTIGAITLLSCASFGLATYCMPFLSVILGVVGLVAAKDSANPERTRLLSWISIGVGGLILLLIVALVVLYAVFIGFAITNNKGNAF